MYTQTEMGDSANIYHTKREFCPNSIVESLQSPSDRSKLYISVSKSNSVFKHIFATMPVTVITKYRLQI